MSLRSSRTKHGTLSLPVYIYIYMVPPPPCTHACLPNLGFGKGWVLELQDGVG